jgi:hypothetical protein
MRRKKILRMILLSYLIIQTNYNLFSLVAYTTQTLTGTISSSLFPSLKKLYSGKHCIVTFSDGNSQNIAPVEKHTRLPFSIDGSYNLVGLVLLRNRQIGLYPPNETIWRISTDSKFINDGQPVQISIICLRELNSIGRGGWLSSLTIDCFLALLSNFLGRAQLKSRNILVDSSFYHSFHMIRDDGIDMVSEGEQTVYMKYGLNLWTTFLVTL